MSLHPKIEESAIMQALDAVCTPMSTDRILTGSFLALVDSFDRRINRKPFIDLANKVVGLHDLLGRLQIVNNMLLMLKNGALTEKELESALHGLTLRSEEYRKKLVEDMDLVVQCPVPGDKIS